jgi:pyruvate,water dikinase
MTLQSETSHTLPRASRLVTPGEQLRDAEVTRIGGKAAGLARLGAVARVPAWFVVEADAFRARLGEAGVAQAVAAALAPVRRVDLASSGARTALEEAERELRAAVERPIEGDLRAVILAAVARLGPGPYAVRSSSTSEDAAERSFAGQFDTLLEQLDADAVVHAVVRCWGSAFTARSLAYRLRSGLELDRAGMAVIVQRMVRGEVSGVAFTANPVNRRRDEAVVTACWGLGEGVVGGACTTDEFVVGHDGGERRLEVASKDVRVVPAPGGGTREEPVPDALRDVRCLTPERVSRLVHEALEIARAEGRPLDLEWTIDAGGTLHWLQARPITTLGPAAPPPRGERVVWDNSNIQESYCGVTTPLTFSFALRAYASVYEQSLRLVGVPGPTIDAMRPVLRNLLGLLRGRVYYNLNNWYRLLGVLPSFGRNKADMEKMMGVEEPVDFVVDDDLSAGDKLRRAPRLALTAARVLREFARLDREVPAFLARFERVMAGIDRARLAEASIDELMDQAARLRREAMERWETPIVNDLYVMQASGRLRRRLESIVGPDRAAEAWTALVAGGEGIESTEPTRALLRLAAIARRVPGVARALRASPAESAVARACDASPEFARGVERFLERYGDRCMGELKLESISLREDLAFVARILVNYLDRPDLDPDALAARDRSAREAMEREVLATAGGPLARERLRRALRATRDGIRARENMRLARTRAFGAYRDLYRAVGQRLVEAGRLDAPRDVFYLTVEEIEAWCAGTAVSADLAGIARARREEFARYERELAPNRIETRGPVHELDPLPPPPIDQASRRARTLRGTGASAGRVEAPLRVVLSAGDDLSVNGHILTTVRTDPGWAPLFPTASAVLVERGSTLSHSAVLARELGIPCVVGVPNLLAIVRDGERVRLDGASGTVERLDADGDGATT